MNSNSKRLSRRNFLKVTALSSIGASSMILAAHTAWAVSGLSPSSQVIGNSICTIKSLPKVERPRAAAHAIRIRPLNAPEARIANLPALDGPLPPEFIEILTERYWGEKGVDLTVGFLDNPPADLRARILMHMNAWSETANVKFHETATDAQVRIARTHGGKQGGHWSNLGTDILWVPRDLPTMNLDSFTMNTPESEFIRVVRHETGHTLGCPHEHRRTEIVARIDRAKAIAYFKTTQNWSEAMVIEQVLKPIDISALLKGAPTDPMSIMCYGIPAEIMKDGIAVPGGDDINAQDRLFIASAYPKPGDLNKDGRLDSDDATNVLRMVVGLGPKNFIGDLNGNGKMDTGDATLILKAVVNP